MLARLVLGAVTAGAMVVPALAGMMNADEARKFVAGKVFAFTCFDGTRGAGRMPRRSSAPPARSSSAAPVRSAMCACPATRCRSAARRVCASHQGPSVRAVLQSRQARRALVPRLGLGHGLRLLRFPSPGRVADADGARRWRGRARCIRRIDRRARLTRDAEVSARVETPRGRERQARAGEIEPKPRPVGAGQGRKRAGTAPLDRLIAEVFPFAPPSRSERLFSSDGDLP